MNICYKVFHIEGMGQSAFIRSELTRKIKAYLNPFFNELHTPTVQIMNQDQYEEFNRDYGLLNPTFEFKYGELGVWASNLLAMKNFLESDYDVLILMEDDIEYHQDFVPLLRSYLNDMPKDWDLFSYFCHSNQFSRFVDIYDGAKIVPAYQDWSMLCYLVNKKGAQKILDSVKETGLTMPIDWYIFRQPERFTSYTPAPNALQGCHLYETTSTFQHIDERVKLV